MKASFLTLGVSNDAFIALPGHPANGSPPTHPSPAAEPADPAVWHHPHEYLLGDSGRD